MREQLNYVLLIDDDEPTNFYHQLIVDASECAKECVCVAGGQEALDFLMTKINGEFPQPEMIFLDINMPGMNGWEFMDKYRQLPPEQTGDLIVVMLTTSLNPDDKMNARNLYKIEDYLNKPLTVEMLNELIGKYFEEKVS